MAFFAGAIPGTEPINRKWTWKVQGQGGHRAAVVAYLIDARFPYTRAAVAGHERRRLVRKGRPSIQQGTGLRVLIVTGSYFLTAGGPAMSTRFFLYEKWIFSGRSPRAAAAALPPGCGPRARANRNP